MQYVPSMRKTGDSTFNAEVTVTGIKISVKHGVTINADGTIVAETGYGAKENSAVHT